jgi:hypothetical protein
VKINSEFPVLGRECSTSKWEEKMEFNAAVISPIVTVFCLHYYIPHFASSMFMTKNVLRRNIPFMNLEILSSTINIYKKNMQDTTMNYSRKKYRKLKMCTLSTQ